MPTSRADLNQDNILIVAAEASSCMYAIRFMEQWKEIFPQSHFFGVGDEKMKDSGMECLGYAEEMAVVGIQEVVSHWNVIKDCFNGILKSCDEKKPRFALLLDYPGFNLRLAKKLKEKGIPVVYYISPQLWAWKKGRVKQVRDYVEDMLVVFPFEVDFYKKHGIEAHFVGHPLVEVVEEDLLDTSVDLSDGGVLGLMPGSRKSEINHNFIVQLQTAQKLREKHNLKIKVLVAPTLSTHYLETLAGALAQDVEFVKDRPTKMIRDCDLILTASGTATLQVALCEKPMVVMYRMNPITAFLARLLVRDVKSFCIVNLISDQIFIPEFFQNDANPKKLSKALEKIILDESYRENMMSKLKSLKIKLGDGEATKNVVEFLKSKYN